MTASTDPSPPAEDDLLRTPGRAVRLWYDALVDLSRGPQTLPVARLVKLARELRVVSREAETFDALCRQTVAEVGRGWPDDETLAAAVTSRLGAATAVWVAAQYASLRQLEPDAVLALLFGDAARLVGRPSRRSDDRGATHAATSAAWLGGVDGFPSVATRAIGRHHERLDGTGLPDGLKAASLSLTDRFVAILARLAERVGPLPIEKAWLRAASAVDFESRCGELDLTLTHAVLDALSLPVSADDALLEETPQVLARTDLGRRRLRLDAAVAADAAVPTPHMDLAVAAGGRRPPLSRPARTGPRSRVDVAELMRSARGD
ncbi:MAG: HD domain-containing phosphohydrolase [Planctomycetota bacterium]